MHGDNERSRPDSEDQEESLKPPVICPKYGRTTHFGATVNVNIFFGSGKWETVIFCYLERNIRKSLVQPLRQSVIG